MAKTKTSKAKVKAASAKVKAASTKVPNVRAKFASLPLADQKRIARRLYGTLRSLGYFGRGGYKTVHGPDQLNRPRVTAETIGEIGQLTIDERNRIISLARNAARNSDRLEGILHQLEINVVGETGGKASFQFPAGYEKAGETIKAEFANWAQECEYFEDDDLQDVLKKVLRTQMLGGDLVLVFDDDLTSGSTGQIIAFEPDCIGDLEGFAEKYPGLNQFQGIVKNANGKTVGVTVSWSQRGRSEYSQTGDDGRLAAWTLIKPEGQRWKDTPFMIYRDSGRFNQIRGSSRLWPGLGTVADLSDLQGFEVQAAKLGAQKIGQVLEQADEQKGELAGELDPDAEAPINDEDVEAAIEDENANADEDDREKLDIEKIEGAGVIWDLMPPGVKMELFDTKHPNDKLVEFSNWLHGGVAFAIGLGKASATGEASASYSGAMMELLLSSIEYGDEFHKLEKRFLDWLLANWARWAQRRGLIPADDKLPADWRRVCVKWQRPHRRAIDPVKEQTALNFGLKNGTILYRDHVGPDWREHVDALAEELEYFKSKGVPHLMLETANGTRIEDTNKNENADNGEEGQE